jgi:large subunit ribosomal protein L9
MKVMPKKTKVMLKKNVAKLGTIGDVVEVKPGYARNYLLPLGIAVEPTEANIKAIEVERLRFQEQATKDRKAQEARADAVRGKEITISARANEEGQLYGSIGPAQIAAALADDDVFVEPEHIVLDEPIRKLDKYDVMVRFAEGITTEIYVWVVPTHDEENVDPETPAPGDDGQAESADSADSAGN